MKERMKEGRRNERANEDRKEGGKTERMKEGRKERKGE